MSFAKSLPREAALLVRDRAFVAALVLVFLLSSLAVIGGLLEVREQQQTIERLLLTDEEDRQSILSNQSDWGGAAYYSFHLTYDPPTPFAFAALGQRDSAPWKHRIRMLALEGQIYERDAGNPVFALIGRFDFAFFAAFVLPLILIALLHDLRAGERDAGRHDLLVATAGTSASLWGVRAAIISFTLFAAAIVPFIVACMIGGTGVVTLISAVGFVALYVLFWALISYYFSAWRQPAAVILALLLGVWAMLAVIIPAGGRIVIDGLVPLPSGSEILMTQREAVNDGWDLPKATTMDAFLERHPQWSAYAEIERPFEWKWYYAFQQVGDQRAESLANAYREGKQHRDRLAGRLAILAPPALLERSLQGLAETDTEASLAYEAEVRRFHAALRDYYYPKLFREEPFDRKALGNLPQFSAAEPSP